MHNLVIETTRLGTEVKNSGRCGSNRRQAASSSTKRRARALESVVASKPTNERAAAPGSPARRVASRRQSPAGHQAERAAGAPASGGECPGCRGPRRGGHDGSTDGINTGRRDRRRPGPEEPAAAAPPTRTSQRCGSRHQGRGAGPGWKPDLVRRTSSRATERTGDRHAQDELTGADRCNRAVGR